LPQGLLPALVCVVREHHPRLKLVPGVPRMFSALRSHGFRIGILTNGPREIQARKAAALGLARYVDTIVYATDHGTRQGKPDQAAFAAVLSRLNVPPAHAVMVGDDERCDVEGGRAAGLLTVRSSVFVPAEQTAAHGLVSRFSAIVPTICRLLEQEHAHHAA
jgi:putative hydrolase of the HAD superfamily